MSGKLLDLKAPNLASGPADVPPFGQAHVEWLQTPLPTWDPSAGCATSGTAHQLGGAGGLPGRRRAGVLDPASATRVGSRSCGTCRSAMAEAARGSLSNTTTYRAASPSREKTIPNSYGSRCCRRAQHQRDSPLGHVHRGDLGA